MKQLWKIICLAYQGDIKHCTTPCLHCAKIEEALAGNKEYNEKFPDQHFHNFLLSEVERLTLENWQLKGALGYSIPSHIEQGDFKCGLCEARRNRPQKFAPRMAKDRIDNWHGKPIGELSRGELIDALGWCVQELRRHKARGLRMHQLVEADDIGPPPVRSAWPYD